MKIAGSIHVVATKPGFYGSLRDVGDKFYIKTEEELGNWMERLDADESSETEPPRPAYRAYHRGGGRWGIEDANDQPFGDFLGSKEEAHAEADRLNAGGTNSPAQENPDLPDA